MKTFDEYLQEEFIKGLEFGGIPITKDNCQDLFENWLSGVDVNEVIGLADKAISAREEEWREKGLELFKKLKMEAEIANETVFLHECNEQIKHFTDLINSIK